ncbi:MAG: PHP domain-containing protein, partial [Bowdeniella nasicola]|nr:PHP domain-containing protein [Bowdeniella nasicola]
MTKPIAYAELHARSAYSFLIGANQPAALVERAAALELEALALTDNAGMYGIVQHVRAAQHVNLPAIVGAEIRHHSPEVATSSVVALCRNARDYAALSRAIANAQLAAGDETGGGKREVIVELDELGASECFVLTGAPQRGALAQLVARGERQAAEREIERLIAHVGRERIGIEIVAQQRPTDSALHDGLAALAAHYRLPLVATGDVHCAELRDFQLLTALQATGQRAALADADAQLPAFPQLLRSGEQMAKLHHRHPAAVANAAAIGRECIFDFS